MSNLENRNWTSNFKAIATITAVAFVLLVFIPVFCFVYIPVYAGSIPVSVIVEEGEGLRVIASLLKENRLIRSELVFMAYVKLKGQDGNLKAGKYNFSGRLDVPDITSILANGLSESEDIQVLIPEGFNVWEIDKRLVELGLIKEGEFSPKYYNEEGYLFPDTYQLQNQNAKIKNQNDADFIEHPRQGRDNEKFEIEELREKMRENFQQTTAGLFKNLSAERQKESVIIASILEKEARSEQDMRLVAGIIYKRLELGILLQVDATVVYGACLRLLGLSPNNLTSTKSQAPNHKQTPNSNDQNSKPRNCDVTFQGVAREIKIDGPYNTYIKKGLPPGPISNPGLKSIEAALNPQKSDYLYYLSTRDGSQMIYSKTPGEHVANRRKYLGI